jgi:hypothetical protein
VLNLSAREAANANDYVLAPSVVLWSAPDGPAQLIDLDGDFYALSQTAAEMLRAVLARGAGAAARGISEDYSIELARAEADLSDFLARLQRVGLIERPNASAVKRKLKAFAAKALVVPPLRLLRPVILARRSRPLMLMVFARICIAVFGWQATVMAWRAALHPHKSRGDREDEDSFLREVEHGIRVSATKMPSIACKEKALSCWYLVCAAGAPAALVVGIQQYPLGGHCWCAIGERILSDSSANCRTYMPVMQYDP